MILITRSNPTDEIKKPIITHESVEEGSHSVLTYNENNERAIKLNDNAKVER